MAVDVSLDPGLPPLVTRPAVEPCPRLRIAIATSAPALLPFRSLPRGMVAIPHYLAAFGHRVRHIDAPDVLCAWRALAELRDFQPDVILAHMKSALILGGLRRLGLVDCPVVHAWDDYYAEQNARPYAPKALLWPFERASVVWADYVVSVSPFNLHLARRWGMPAEFIPHGVSPENEPTGVRLESTRVKVVYLGAQMAYKGSFDLVESVRDLDCDLFMVGEPNATVRRRAPANVTFVGSVPAAQLPAVLRQADILINSSDQDSNFKLYDYMRAGRAVLGRRGYAEWILRHDEDAWLVNDLRTGLRELIERPSLRLRLGEALGRRPVLTWEEVSRRHEATLARVVQQARTGTLPRRLVEA